jgi:phage-related protein
LSLDESVAAEVPRMVFALGEAGNTLREPDSKSLGDGLFELRVRDQLHIRIIYMFSSNKIVLLHAFVKKTRRIPKNDMKYANTVRTLYYAYCN